MLIVNAEILQFVLAFSISILWYRILFFVIPVYFKRPLTRSLLKLRWHHFHWGIVLIVFGTTLLLLYGKTTAVIILFGVGLGFIIDLFIPSLLLETDREKELVVYRNSLVPTLLLGVSIIFIIIVLSFSF